MSRTAALTGLLVCLAALPATAGTYGNVPPDNVAVAEVLPGWRDGTRHVAAIRIHLAPGWKTYWRAPGEAGIPPAFAWSGSQNLAGVSIHWPVPTVFDQNGFRSIGYSGTLTLPIAISTQTAGPVLLRGRLDMGVCEHVCVPFSVDFSAELPAGGAADPEIRAALADRPATAREAGVGAVTCAVDPIRDGLRLTATLALPRQGRDEMVVIETGSEGVWVSEATTARNGNRLTAAADLVPPNAKPFPLDRSLVRITVLSPGRAVDIRGCDAG
jgi:DsbC/DsbD-like thiol-disulfide interchange protein